MEALPMKYLIPVIYFFFFRRYTPLFEYFLDLSDVAFKILADEYVKDDSGTGVVHCAPAFGEDDYRVCLLAGIIDLVTHTVFLFSYCKLLYTNKLLICLK